MKITTEKQLANLLQKPESTEAKWLEEIQQIEFSERTDAGDGSTRSRFEIDYNFINDRQIAEVLYYTEFPVKVWRTFLGMRLDRVDSTDSKHEVVLTVEFDPNVHKERKVTIHQTNLAKKFLENLNHIINRREHLEVQRQNDLHTVGLQPTKV